MLVKTSNYTFVAAVEGSPQQSASHDCPTPPPAHGAGDPSEPPPGGTGGGCTSVVMQCMSRQGVTYCIPVCLN